MPNKRRYWIIKTRHGRTFVDYWINFKDEKVVAIGWERITDPRQLTDEQLREQIGMHYNIGRDPVHIFNTIRRFQIEIGIGDELIVAKGYRHRVGKDIYLYGFAKIAKKRGEFTFDVGSTWWKCKRQVKFELIGKCVPRQIFVNCFGQTFPHTLHEVDEACFRKFKQKIKRK